MDLQNIQNQLNTEFAKSETRIIFWFDDKADRSGNGDTRKRTEEDDVRFAQSFEKLILMAKSKEGAQSGTI